MMRLTTNAIRIRVAEIAEARDDERAHEMEDRLFVQVLVSIVNAPDKVTKAEMRRMAAEALKAREIDFERWRG